MPSLPTPVYIFEQVNGFLWQQADLFGLAVIPAVAPDEANIIADGLLTLRYGIEIQRSTEAIIPGLFMAESGATKTGRDAWDWLWNKFQLYPRAEVIGLRSDGSPVHLYVRDLDFGYPPRVLVYADTETLIPLASIQQLLAPQDAPELLKKYLG